MSQRKPPVGALKFLRWFCKPSYVESIEGDLFELFQMRLEATPTKAYRYFWYDTIRFLKPRYIRSFDDIPLLIPFQMVRNYLKIGFRSLWKYRYYTAINVLGLSIGLACCLLIFLFVKHETSYDEFYPDAERIYRITHTSGGGYTPARMVAYMQNDYPEIETGTRIMGTYTTVFKTEGQYIREDGGAIVDSTFFNVFDTRFIEGSPEKALNNPNSIVLTEKLAKKYFPEESAYGKVIKIDGELKKITAVVADPPKNTHFPYSYLMDIPREDWAMEGYWTGNNFYSYLKLKRHSKKEYLEAKFPDFVEKYIGPEIVEYSSYKTYQEYINDGNQLGFRLFPLLNIHLAAPNLNFANPGDIDNVVAFVIIAFLILIIACINYINMATSRGALRSKEVGLRKVMGSSKLGLISQFLVESVLTTITALVLSFLFAFLVLPFFGELMDRSFPISDLLQPVTVGAMFFLLVIVGLLAGGYPAYFLSAYSPVQALRGSISGKGNTKLRRGMVVFQYAISLFLITVTLVVYLQVDFMRSQNLGINKDQLYIIENADELGDNTKRFSERLQQNPNLTGIAASNQLLFNFIADWNYSTNEDESRRFSPRNMFVSQQYLNVTGIKLSAGRFFDGRQTDSTSVVINESFAKQLGWEDPIGKTLTRGGNNNFNIIGVVEDFNFGSLRKEISPFLFRSIEVGSDDFANINFLMVKTKGDPLQNVEFIERAWNELAGNAPLEGAFLDSFFNNLFEEEKRFGKIFGSFSLLGVIIAILGLFALVAFTMEKRFKELAIRKVMGATVSDLLSLVLKDFSKLVILGFIVALPVAYYLLDDWLNEYAYRVELSWYLLFLPFIFLILLTWIVVYVQSYQTTIQNPAIALKDE